MADNAVALDGVAGIRPPLWIPMNSPDDISDSSCEALPASYPLSIPSPVASPGRAPTKRHLLTVSDLRCPKRRELS